MFKDFFYRKFVTEALSSRIFICGVRFSLLRHSNVIFENEINYKVNLFLLSLTHSFPMHTLSPENIRKKTSGGIEMEHWLEMGQLRFYHQANLFFLLATSFEVKRLSFFDLLSPAYLFPHSFMSKNEPNF